MLFVRCVPSLSQPVSTSYQMKPTKFVYRVVDTRYPIYMRDGFARISIHEVLAELVNKCDQGNIVQQVDQPETVSQTREAQGNWCSVIVHFQLFKRFPYGWMWLWELLATFWIPNRTWWITLVYALQAVNRQVPCWCIDKALSTLVILYHAYGLDQTMWCSRINYIRIIHLVNRSIQGVDVLA